MMVGVTESGGTGEQAAIPGFRVAGKTGTAQKADPLTGGYSHDKRVASFMGFAPADHPRIAALVVVDEPTSSPYGGVVAAPAFARIAEATLRYLRVMPEDGEGYVGGPTPAWIPAGDKGIELDGTAPASGTGKDPGAAAVALASPASQAPEQAPTPGDRQMIPDVRGISAREAMKKLSEVGFSATVLGSGRVSRQSPEPGTWTPRFAAVSLILERCGDKACAAREVAVARALGGKR